MNEPQLPKQGQIVEIPRDSHHYSSKKKVFENKREELEYYSSQPNYTLFDGILVGGHFGMEEYKIGQRKGLNLSGMSNALYVIKKDYAENRLFVGAGEDHPGLFQKVIFIPKENIIWEREINLNKDIALNVTIKYNKNTKQALFYHYSDGVFIEFEEPIKKFDLTNGITVYKHDQIIAKTSPLNL